MTCTQTEILPGTERDHSLSQFFTPPKLAAKLVGWACDYRGGYIKTNGDPLRVLEPSAGNGAIVRELVKAGAQVDAVELDTRYYDELCDALQADAAWCGEDFLNVLPRDPRMRAYDLACGNFPFHADLDGSFTWHALKFAPRVVAIYPANVFYSAKRVPLWTQARPTRIAHLSKRPWPGATDYVVLELVKRSEYGYYPSPAPDGVTVEWWTEDWS